MFVRFEIACVDNFNDMDNNWSNAIVTQTKKGKYNRIKLFGGILITH